MRSEGADPKSKIGSTGKRKFLRRGLTAMYSEGLSLERQLYDHLRATGRLNPCAETDRLVRKFPDLDLAEAESIALRACAQKRREAAGARDGYWEVMRDKRVNG